MNEAPFNDLSNILDVSDSYLRLCDGGKCIKQLMMRENNNINDTCRLCLAKVDKKQFIPIFPQTYLNGVSLVMKIMVCVSLTIQEDDPFPKKICKDCEESVNTFYSFREACCRAYFMLIQNFGESKDPIDEPESEPVDVSDCPEESEESASEETRSVARRELIVPGNESDAIFPEIIDDERNTRAQEYSTCLEKENNTDNKSFNDNSALEGNIPRHHIICPDADNHSIDGVIMEGRFGSQSSCKIYKKDVKPLETEFSCQDGSLSPDKVIDAPVIDSKSVQKSEEESSSAVDKDSLTGCNADVDCYQVEEIREQILCGEEIKQQIRYKCLRCENNFDDLDSITTHYTEFCRLVDHQEAEGASTGSNDGKGSSKYLNAFEYLGANFELENKEPHTLQYSNDEELDSGNRIETNSVVENNEHNHCVKRKLIPDNCNSTNNSNSFDSTSFCTSSTATASLILVSRKSCDSRIEQKLSNPSSKPQLINLRRTQKRNVHWQEKTDHPCPECGRIFTSGSLLKRHSLVHTGERPHICEICERRFAQLGQLNFHRKFHNNPRYRCHICSKPFLRPSDIEKHMRTHTGEKPYDCKICLKSFAQLGALQQHSRIHSGEKPYSCEICGKTFSQKANKTKHVKIHKEGKRPHTCQICGRSFSNLSEMELHRAGHGGGRPRKCDYCDDSFRKLSELNHHVRRFHTFERQHKCMFCPKEFYSIYNLKQHVMVHTGQRPYACSKCDLRFTQKGNLTKHFERKHSEFIEKKDRYILVEKKSLDEENVIFIDENDPDDHLIVEREETIESAADASLKRDCL